MNSELQSVAEEAEELIPGWGRIIWAQAKQFHMKLMADRQQALAQQGQAQRPPQLQQQAPQQQQQQQEAPKQLTPEVFSMHDCLPIS